MPSTAVLNRQERVRKAAAKKPHTVFAELFLPNGKSHQERKYKTGARTIQHAVAQLRGLRDCSQVVPFGPTEDYVADWDGFVHVRLYQDGTQFMGSWVLDFRREKRSRRGNQS